jgi:hypothetical protein
MKKTVVPFKLSISYIDASADISRRFLLLSELLLLADSDPAQLLGFNMLRELGSELQRLIRARAALDVVVGATSFFYDDEFNQMVRDYRKRLSE